MDCVLKGGDRAPHVLSGVALLTAGTGVRERVRARRRQVCGGDGLASQPAQRVLRYGLRPVVLVSRR